MTTKWYIMQDSDWQWDSSEAPSIIVKASSPEAAVWYGLAYLDQDSPGTDGVQFTVAEISPVALADCEKNEEDGLWGITKIQDLTEKKVTALQSLTIMDKDLDTILEALLFATQKSNSLLLRSKCKALFSVLNGHNDG